MVVKHISSLGKNNKLQVSKKQLLRKIYRPQKRKSVRNAGYYKNRLKSFASSVIFFIKVMRIS
jgi:hypothetical protein